jgi:hypothetical protein
MDPQRPEATAIAIRGGRIAYVGGDERVARSIGPGTRVIELEGRLVLPGFHDTHVHPVTGGIELGECDLNEAEDRAAVLAMVRECARQAPLGAWIRGGGWQLPLFPGANPGRLLLDSLVGDRPAYLSAADGHSAWVSSAALAAAGVTRATPDPPNGRIERDARGEPSGTLRESAMALVSRVLPEYTAEDYVAGLRRGLAMANRFGITSLHEASADERILEAYATLERAGELTARVIASLRVDLDAGAGEVERLAALRERYTARLLRPVAAKIFADGVIEARTAALLAPYVGAPGDSGTLNLSPDHFRRLARSLDSAGFKVHVHAIGDRAIREAFDALQHARQRNGRFRRRHILSHIQLFHPEDIPRFASLGVVASFQPLWAYADQYITELTEPVLGAERSRWLYPIASVVRTGAVVAAGSDWSVSSMNPLLAIQVAMTRRPPDTTVGPAWIPEERVDLATMVAAYTINGAIASDDSAETGSLAVGKAADLIVLDRDLFALPPHETHRARVLLTMLEGRIVHEDALRLGFRR